MLSPTQLGEAGDEVAAVYAQIEAEMLDHLVETMLSGDITSKTATELALLVQTHEQELRDIIAKNRDAIDASILDTVETYLEAADADDRDRLLTDDKLAPAQMVATAKSLSEVLTRDNLHMLQGAKDAFLRASVEAVTQVNAGYLTADKAVHKAVRKLARDGINVITYQNVDTGKVTVSNKADVAVRRHVRTQIAQAANKMSMERLDKLDIKLVEVSSHHDARPSHAEWQGQCYSLNGEVTIDGIAYKDFYIHCMSGDLGDILGGVNCKHSFGPYRHGAPRRYEPNPKHPSGLPGAEIYKLEQKQRYLECQIRADKRELRAAQLEHEKEGSLSSKTALIKAQEKLKRRQETMREFIKEANARSKDPHVSVLTRKPNREWAGDMPKSKMVPASHRNVNKFLDQKSIKSQMQSAGISKTRMKAEISAEMLRRGGTTADFASLTAKEQNDIKAQILCRKATLPIEERRKSYKPANPAFLKARIKEIERAGGTVWMDDEATRYLNAREADAATLGDVVALRHDATLSEILEEEFHFHQYKRGDYTECNDDELLLRREIDAQRYLLDVSTRYRIPRMEADQTRAALKRYQEELDELLNEGN